MKQNCPQNPIPPEAKAAVKAKMDGYSAGLSRTPTQNPYPFPTLDHVNWQNGYEQGYSGVGAALAVNDSVVFPGLAFGGVCHVGGHQ